MNRPRPARSRTVGLIPTDSTRVNETSDTGALATCASVTIFPFSPRTQIAD